MIFVFILLLLLYHFHRALSELIGSSISLWRNHKPLFLSLLILIYMNFLQKYWELLLLSLILLTLEKKSLDGVNIFMAFHSLPISFLTISVLFFFPVSHLIPFIVLLDKFLFKSSFKDWTYLDEDFIFIHNNQCTIL